MTVISAWWRLNKSFSKIQWTIVWALNYYLTQLSSSPRAVASRIPAKLETRCGRESHTRLRGPSGTPMEWTPGSREQEKHNVTVITVGSRYYSLCSVSSSLSHATLEQPFWKLTNKVRGKILLKKSSCVFLHASVFVVVSWIILHIYVHVCRCESAYVTI